MNGVIKTCERGCVGFEKSIIYELVVEYFKIRKESLFVGYLMKQRNFVPVVNDKWSWGERGKVKSECPLLMVTCAHQSLRGLFSFRARNSTVLCRIILSGRLTEAFVVIIKYTTYKLKTFQHRRDVQTAYDARSWFRTVFNQFRVIFRPLRRSFSPQSII